MDRHLARKRAEDARQEAEAVRRRSPGYGTHRYRGDPYEALSLDEVARRYEVCAERVTLNGKPAQISGVYKPMAIVRTLDRTSEAVWAWPTAILIARERGGRFSV